MIFFLHVESFLHTFSLIYHMLLHICLFLYDPCANDVLASTRWSEDIYPWGRILGGRVCIGDLLLSPRGMGNVHQFTPDRFFFQEGAP